MPYTALMFVYSEDNPGKFPFISNDDLDAVSIAEAKEKVIAWRKDAMPAHYSHAATVLYSDGNIIQIQNDLPGDPDLARLLTELREPAEGATAEFATAEFAEPKRMLKGRAITAMPGFFAKGEARVVHGASSDRTLNVKTATILQRITQGATSIAPQVETLVGTLHSEIERLQGDTPNDPLRLEDHLIFVAFLERLRSQLKELQTTIDSALNADDSADQPVFLGKAAKIAAAIELAIGEEWSKNGHKHVAQIVTLGTCISAAALASSLGIAGDLIQVFTKHGK